MLLIRVIKIYIYHTNIVFYRLLKQIKAPIRKRIIAPLLELVVYGSKAVSTVRTYDIFL